MASADLLGNQERMMERRLLAAYELILSWPLPDETEPTADPPTGNHEAKENGDASTRLRDD